MADADFLAPSGTVDRELLVGRGSHDNESFGALLRRSRIDAGLTAKQLAAKADVDPTFVRAIERGKQSPSTATAHKLFASTETDVRPADQVRSPLGTDLVIKDPASDQLVYVQFKASKRGENNRSAVWSTLPDDESMVWVGPEEGTGAADTDALLASIVRRVATADRSTLSKLSVILDHLGVEGR